MSPPETGGGSGGETMVEDGGSFFVSERTFVNTGSRLAPRRRGIDFGTGTGDSCAVNPVPEGATCQVAWPINDTQVEWTENFWIHWQFQDQPETETVLAVSISDDDVSGPPPASISYAAMASSALEGRDVILSVESSPTWQFEYWVEDVSAVRGIDYTDPGNTSSSSWAAIGAVGQVSFPTIDTLDYEGTRSFAIHVRLVGFLDTEIVLEADIYDFEDTIVQTVAYSYDVFSQLIRRTHDPDGPHYEDPALEQFFIFDAGQIVLQFDGIQAVDLSHRYLWGPQVDQLLVDEVVTSLTEAGDLLWPLADHLGTIRDIAERVGGVTSIITHRIYDSFGNLANPETATDLLFGYTGRFWDAATGLQNNLHRWYDPRTAKWTSEDPIGFGAGDPNLQRYVGNNPLSFTDPSGLIVKPTRDRDRDYEELIAHPPDHSKGLIWDLELGAYRPMTWWEKIFLDPTNFLPGPAPIGAIGGPPKAILGGLGKGALKSCGDDAAKLLSRVWPKHHPFPMYLGGAIDQTLKKIPKSLHKQFHAALDKWKGGIYDRRHSADHFKNFDKKKIIQDLREFYEKAEKGAFKKYLCDFEQAVKESGY